MSSGRVLPPAGSDCEPVQTGSGAELEEPVRMHHVGGGKHRKKTETRESESFRGKTARAKSEENKSLSEALKVQRFIHLH